jgi:hypothetical protein
MNVEIAVHDPDAGFLAVKVEDFLDRLEKRGADLKPPHETSPSRAASASDLHTSSMAELGLEDVEGEFLPPLRSGQQPERDRMPVGRYRMTAVPTYDVLTALPPERAGISTSLLISILILSRSPVSRR